MHELPKKSKVLAILGAAVGQGLGWGSLGWSNQLHWSHTPRRPTAAFMFAGSAKTLDSIGAAAHPRS